MRYTQNLFAYGTLQQEGVQKSVLNRTLKGKKDVLKGYRISEKKIHGKYPLIEVAPMPPNEVEGMIFQVSNFELHEIDHYETKMYKRVQVTLKSGTEAWTYVENFGST